MTTPDDVDASGARRYVIGGLASASIGLVAAVGLAFLVNAVAARILSTADLAAFLLLISIGQALGSTVDLGLPPLVVRELALSRRDGSRFLTDSWILSLGAGLLLVVVAILVAKPAARAFSDQQAVIALAPWVGALTAVRGWERLTGDSFRGLRDVRRAVGFGNVGTQLGAALLLVGLLAFNVSDANTALAAYVAGGAASLVVAGTALRHRFTRINLHRTWKSAPSMLAESRSLILHRSTFLLLQQAPLWIVGATLLEAPTANYGLAQRLVTLIGFPLLIVNQVVPPLIARGLSLDRVQLERTLRATATAAAVPATIVLGTFTLAGGPVLGLLFGSQYRAAATPLAILSVGFLANVLAGSCGPVLVQAGHQKLLWRITAISTMVTLGVAALVARPFGVNGVAVTASAGLLGSNIAMILAVWRREQIKTFVGTRAFLDGFAEVRRLITSRPG